MLLHYQILYNFITFKIDIGKISLSFISEKIEVTV
jgi:hypothetical protein